MAGEVCFVECAYFFFHLLLFWAYRLFRTLSRGKGIERICRFSRSNHRALFSPIPLELQIVRLIEINTSSFNDFVFLR
jgi:hypothetical protein